MVVLMGMKYVKCDLNISSWNSQAINTTTLQHK